MSFLRQHKTAVSNLSLVVIMLVGAGYLLVVVARVKPPNSTYSVTVQLDRSGGLQPGGDVTWRGYRVGKVKEIALTEGGAAVSAVAEIDKKYHIPADTDIAVQAMSGAGEQYLDFRPNSDKAPYLEDGTVVRFDPKRITTPTPIWQAIANSNDLIAQIDPDKFGVILNELDTALSGGPDQLRHLIEGFSIATTGLDNLLPQTTSLIQNLRSIAATSSHAQPDLGTLTRNSHLLIDQVNGANAELRRLLDDTPAKLAVADDFLTRNDDPIHSLAGNMAAIVNSAIMRMPALRALFPALVIGTSAMGVPAHDNEFYTIVDIWSRPWCKYSTRQGPPYVVQDGTLPRWNYCENPPAEQQIRGSANAPRPDIPNNGQFMPTGVDPNERTLPPVR